MAVRPDVPGRRTYRPPPAAAVCSRRRRRRRADVDAVPPAEVTPADAPTGEFAAGTSSAGLEPAAAGIPRWLLLLVGAAAATIAVAGLRAIAWLVGPVFLALVVVIALTPVQGWLRRKGAPGGWPPPSCWSWSGRCCSSFVGLLVLAVAQTGRPAARTTPGQAEVLINGSSGSSTTPASSPASCPTWSSKIDYSQLVGVATGLLSRLTDAAEHAPAAAHGAGVRGDRVGRVRPPDRRWSRRSGRTCRSRLSLFAQGTRSYLVVSTVFGAIVAVGDCGRAVSTHRCPGRGHLGPARLRHQLRAQHRVRPRCRPARPARPARRRLGRADRGRRHLLGAELRRPDPHPAAVRRATPSACR